MIIARTVYALCAAVSFS